MEIWDDDDEKKTPTRGVFYTASDIHDINFNFA